MSKKSFNFTVDMEMDLKHLKAYFLREGIDLNNTEILEIALHCFCNTCAVDKDSIIDYVKYNYS